MRSALGILVATGALAVVPGDTHLYDLPAGPAAVISQGTTGARIGLGGFTAPDPEARARAACEAGLAGTPGGITAIPALITLLADDARVDAIDCGGEWRHGGIFAAGDVELPCGTSPALEAARALGRLGRAAAAPLVGALRDPRAPWPGATIPELP